MKDAYSNTQIFTQNSNSEWLYMLKWQTQMFNLLDTGIQLFKAHFL